MLRKGRGAIAVLIVALFPPATYLLASARLDESRQPASQASFDAMKYWNESLTVAAKDLPAVRVKLENNPDDVEIRCKLLIYSQFHPKARDWAKELLWFIEYRPNSSALRMTQSISSNRRALRASDIQQLTAAWRNTLAKYPNSADVLFNAVRFLEQDDPARALSLLGGLKDLSSQDQQTRASMEAQIYAAAEIAELPPNAKGNVGDIHMNAALAVRLSDELESSGNAALLSKTGQIVVQMNLSNQAKQGAKGLALIQEAINIDPGNQAWMEALQSAEAEPTRRRNYQELAQLQ